MTSDANFTKTDVPGIVRTHNGFVVRATRKDSLTGKVLDKREVVSSLDIQDAISVKERLVAELKAECDEGKSDLRDIPKSSYKSYTEFFQDYRKNNGVCRLNVISDDQYVFNKFIIPIMGAVKVENINRRAVLHFSDKLRGMTNEDGIPFSLNTYKKAWSLFRNSVRFAYRMGYISSDPTHLFRVSFPCAKTPKVKTGLTKEQAVALLKGAEELGTTEYVVCSLALVLGLRSAEIKCLRFSDINLEAGTISISKSFHRGILNQNVKNGNNFVGSLIGAAYDACLKHFNIWASRKKPHDLFVPSLRSKKVWDNRWINETLGRICKEKNIPLVSIHSLRVTSNTLLLESGIAPEIVSRILNHKSGFQMRQHYTRIQSEQAKAALTAAWEAK
jgi:integrase